MRFYLNKSTRYYKTYCSPASKKEYFSQFIDLDYIGLYTLYKWEEGRSVHIDQPILVNAIPFGSSPTQITWKWGLPVCRFQQKMGMAKFQTAVYKTSFHDIHCYIACHFLQSRLIAAQLCFPHKEQSTRQLLLHLLLDKYQVRAEKAAASFMIHNEASNKIFVENDFYLNLFYFSGDPIFTDTIESILQTKAARKQQLQLERIRGLKEIL